MSNSNQATINRIYEEPRDPTRTSTIFTKQWDDLADESTASTTVVSSYEDIDEAKPDWLACSTIFIGITQVELLTRAALHYHHEESPSRSMILLYEKLSMMCELAVKVVGQSQRGDTRIDACNGPPCCAAYAVSRQ